MTATHIQCGVVNHRINREPLDAETVNTTYAELVRHIEPGNLGGTYTGSFYAGLVTSVTCDDNQGLNGPYYVSYKDSYRDSYTAEKIITEPELAYAVEQVVEEITGVTSYWGHIN